MDLSKKTDKQLNKMLFKDSGYDAQTVRAAVAEMERRGLNPPPASLVTGGREYEHPKAPPKKPKRSAPSKKKMNKGGDATKQTDLQALKKAVRVVGKSLNLAPAAVKSMLEGSPESIAKALKSLMDEKNKLNKGGMAKKKKYNKGGYANCGASVPPAQGKK